MGKLPDIDVDFSNRDNILDIIKHNPASLSDGKKHNTGVYVTDIPMNPLTNTSTIDFKQAEDRGYFKLDFLNVNVYSGIKDEEHLNKLMSKEPSWHRLWEDESFCDKVIHVNGHHKLMVKLKPDSMTRMAMFLAVMRPGKAHLQNYDWKQVAEQVWTKPSDGSYYFKKAHAVAYAHLVAIHINLLEEQGE